MDELRKCLFTLSISIYLCGVNECHAILQTLLPGIDESRHFFVDQWKVPVSPHGQAPPAEKGNLNIVAVLTSEGVSSIELWCDGALYDMLETIVVFGDWCRFT